MTGHAGVALLQPVVPAQRVLPDAGLKDRARGVTIDAVALTEAPSGQTDLLVRKGSAMSVRLMLSVDRRMALSTIAALHDGLLMREAA
jgi:hypothetical protein